MSFEQKIMSQMSKDTQKQGKNIQMSDWPTPSSSGSNQRLQPKLNFSSVEEANLFIKQRAIAIQVLISHFDLQKRNQGCIYNINCHYHLML